MEEFESESSLANNERPEGYTTILIEFRQGTTRLGTVTKYEFMHSGEVPESLIIKEAVQYWNALEANIKDGVTAHIIAGCA